MTVTTLSSLGRPTLSAFINNCPLCGHRWTNYKMQEQCDDKEACMKRKNKYDIPRQR